MAGNGPAPSGNAIRRNKKPEKIKLVAGKTLQGFPLPKGALGVDRDGVLIEWHTETVKWWNAWRRSPQASRMLSEPDWYFLLDTALIHHHYWKTGRWDFASELRQRVAKFGATPEDRKRINAEIEVPEQLPVGTAPAATVTSLASRRARMTGS